VRFASTEAFASGLRDLPPFASTPLAACRITAAQPHSPARGL
jgi:hypothetical protein